MHPLMNHQVCQNHSCRPGNSSVTMHEHFAVDTAAASQLVLQNLAAVLGWNRLGYKQILGTGLVRAVFYPVGKAMILI